MSDHAVQIESLEMEKSIRVGASTSSIGVAKLDLPPRAQKERWEFFIRLRGHRSASIGLVVVFLLALMAIFAPYIAPCNPLKQDIPNALAPPSRAHLLGTDSVGRDLLSRIIVGSRISLSVGLLVVSIAGTIGISMGLLAAYYGGWIDSVICRFIDMLLAFPRFLLALAVLTILGPSLTNAMLAVAISSILCTVINFHFRAADLSKGGRPSSLVL